MTSKSSWLGWIAACVVGCSHASASDGPDAAVVSIATRGESAHSSSIAVSANDATVFVVNADSDSVSFLDARAGKLTTELLLASTAPAVDGGGRFEPSVSPRALALGPEGHTLYVTGQRSGHVYAIDVATRAIVGDQDVCAEPIGVLASPDGATVYVACSMDDAVVALDAATLHETSRTPCNRRPWTLAWSVDRTQLLVTHLLGPGVSALSLSPLAVATVWTTPDGSPGRDAKFPHGPVRGIYDVLARPGTQETWVVHLMLAIDTAQPELDFLRTVFSSVSLFDTAGAQTSRMTVSTAPGDGAAFGDVVSGPRAIAFSPDGRLAFIADTGSEDVLVVDAVEHKELTIVRPLPGHQPEGIAVSHDGRVYVDERNTGDVAVLSIDAGATADAGPSVSIVGSPIARFAKDPMPSDLRLGQHLFYSANSDELPITTDHWVSCSSCHLEGRSDAVTWRFKEGPRDTPSNAGGVLQTGFLLRTAARTKVQDYWQTINDEQGGHFDTSTPLLAADLDALAHYVNFAIPYPRSPRDIDPTRRAHGEALFATAKCATCHSGAAFTDSGDGNPTLDLAGPLMLHDVGTCVETGAWTDVAQPDEQSHPRKACSFDTPTLRGIVESAPYLHDGSADTLMDVLVRTRGKMGDTAALSDADLGDLVEYLRSL